MEPSSSTLASWEIYPGLTESQFRPFREAGIEYLYAQLLYNRGLATPAAIQTFLAARYDQLLDPFMLIDMERGVQRIQKALDDGEHITVYGDFDADGVTSSALMTRALRTLKHPEALLNHHIPDRTREARGFSKEAIDKITAEHKVSLIITTDCGSSDVEAVEYAKTLGIDVIITDHHHPPEQMPRPYAMINPHRPDCTYSERYLCGVGVAFKLAQALYRRNNRSIEEEQALLDLVAIGTVGDVAQLLGENHTLVHLGLQKLNQAANPGLRVLIHKANLQPGHIRERDISHALAPRINAAGRMEHANIAFHLLTTDDELEASTLAERLEALNQQRQQQTEALMASVREEVERHSHDQIVVVSGEDWPEGIIGLVASRLSEEIKRTVFVISRGVQFSRGSARSYDGFNIILALRERPDLFERYGGHAQAAGFTIANERIEELRQHLLNWHKMQHTVVPGVTPTETTELPDPTSVVAEAENISQKVDLVITRPEYLNYSTYLKVRQLSPFGSGNPEPIFKINRLRLLRRWTSGPDGRHLRLRLQVPMKNLLLNGTLMRGGAQLPSFKEGSLVNIIFALEQAWSPPDAEHKQEIWLRLMHVEQAGH